MGQSFENGGGEALPALIRGVEAFFQTYEVTASVRFGWNERARRDNQSPAGASRIVFTPGEYGPPDVLRPMKAGIVDRDGEQNHMVDNPQSQALAWWHLLVTCSVWGVDPLSPQDELKNYVATKRLFLWTLRAIKNARDPDTGDLVGFANIEEWGQPQWTLPPGVAAFGRELTFTFTMNEPQPEVPILVSFPTPVVSRVPAS
jgi:hypothetical protein